MTEIVRFLLTITLLLIGMCGAVLGLMAEWRSRTCVAVFLAPAVLLTVLGGGLV